jgi:hypothetical protein
MENVWRWSATALGNCARPSPVTRWPDFGNCWRRKGSRSGIIRYHSGNRCLGYWRHPELRQQGAWNERERR